MKRHLALIGAAVLAVAAATGTTSAQNGIPVNADGSYVVANDDGENIVSGRGDDIAYGDINTGGGGGEVLGDPSAVYSPLVPEPGSGVPIIPGSGDGLIGGVPIQPAQPAAPDATTQTTTTLATTDGSATENIPVEALVPEETAPAETAPTETAPAATDSGTVTGGFCTQYPTWYDAQIAYENLGGTAADPALVQEVDPNYDGIACEEYMA
jgi:hypothetical protein